MPHRYISESRLISGKIVDDARLNSLEDPWAIEAFVRILLKMDNLGRIEADPAMLKALIFPRNVSVDVEKIEGITRDLHQGGLLFLYSQNEERFFQSPRAYRHQKMVGNMKRASELPEPPGREFLLWLRDTRHHTREDIILILSQCLCKNSYEQVLTCSTDLDLELELELELGKGLGLEKEITSPKDPLPSSSNLNQEKLNSSLEPSEAPALEVDSLALAAAFEKPGWLKIIEKLKPIEAAPDFVSEIEQGFGHLDLEAEAKGFFHFWSEGDAKLKRLKLEWHNWLRNAVDFAERRKRKEGKVKGGKGGKGERDYTGGKYGHLVQH